VSEMCFNLCSHERTCFSRCFTSDLVGWMRLQFAVLNWMISDAFTIRQQFLNVESLRRRFVLMGMANIVFMPFLLPFMAIYFAFKHAEEFQAKRDYLGPRKWSPSALWKMREFNELPHVFERRCALV
jgi:autophagy-related protein 9